MNLENKKKENNINNNNIINAYNKNVIPSL